MTVQPARKREAGFSLIEVLIAVIILSIGLLGVASLQVTSKRGNFEAMQRAAATMYAEDLVERMRTNPTVLGSYVTGTGKEFPTDTVPSAPATCLANQGCSSVAIADFDIASWWGLINGASEGGAGGLVSPTACLFNPAPSEIVVAIAWRGMDEISDEISTSFATAVNDARNCGRGSVGSLYDLNASDMSFRRRIVLYTFIDPQAG